MENDMPNAPNDPDALTALSNAFGGDDGSPGTGNQNPDGQIGGDWQQNTAPAQPSTSDGNQFGSPDDAGSGSDNNPAPGEDGYDPRNDPNRVEYFQSRADRANAELEKLKSQFESQQPILKYINENPAIASKVYGVIQESLGEDAVDPKAQPGSSPNVQTNEPKLTMERPTRPEKPKDYDHYAAMNDPDSESAKYQASLVDYNEKLTEYNEHVAEVEQKRREYISQQQRAQQEEAQIIQQTYQEAVYQHGLQPKEASKFVQWAQNPNYTLRDLIMVWQARQNSGSGQADQLNDRNQRLQSPPPPATTGSGAAPPVQQQPSSEGESWVNAIKAAVGNR